jgi:hypothetical protein
MPGDNPAESFLPGRGFLVQGRVLALYCLTVHIQTFPDKLEYKAYKHSTMVNFPGLQQGREQRELSTP